MKIAILDLGTNTFHLLVAETQPGGTWKKLLKERVTVKLGQGGIEKNIITRSSYSRGLAALKKFRISLDTYNVKRVYAFGTAAMRSAANGKQFLKDANHKFGLNIRLLSGDKEASLIYQGVRQAVKMGNGKSLVMDIGGGSVEFVIADNNKIYWKQSFKLGAALLLGKFTPPDPLTRSDISTISSYIGSMLQPLYQAFDIHRPYQLIGSAGSFETFASMIRHRFPESGSHYGKTSHPIALQHFKELHRELIGSSREERNSMKGLIKMRIDMIVMASLLLNFVIDETGINQIKLSTFSLKEGILWSILNNKL